MALDDRRSSASSLIQAEDDASVHCSAKGTVSFTMAFNGDGPFNKRMRTDAESGGPKVRNC